MSATTPKVLNGSPRGAQLAAGRANGIIYEFRLAIAQGDLVKAHMKLREASQELDTAMREVEDLARLNGAEI